jgi:hypothetical protein
MATITTRCRWNRPWRHSSNSQSPGFAWGLGRLLLSMGLFTRFIGVGASSFGRSIAKAPNGRALIRYVFRAAPLRRSVAGAQVSGSLTVTVVDRWIPLVSAHLACGFCLPSWWQASGRGPRPGSRAAEGRRAAMRAVASTLDVGAGWPRILCCWAGRTTGGEIMVTVRLWLRAWIRLSVTELRQRNICGLSCSFKLLIRRRQENFVVGYV